MTKSITRLAPSRAGALRLGNARTFLINYLLARSRGKRVLMRVEDLDGPRVKHRSGRANAGGPAPAGLGVERSGCLSIPPHVALPSRTGAPHRRWRGLSSRLQLKGRRADRQRLPPRQPLAAIPGVLPLVLGADGRRLAKRHGDTRPVFCRRCGTSPQRMLGLLGYWSGLTDNRQEVSIQELLTRFYTDAIRGNPMVFAAEDDGFL